MVFSSLTFLFLFFPLVIGVYYLCPRALRNLWLLLTSLLFYAWGEPVYIRLMLASILFNYLCGLAVAALQKRQKHGWAKAVLIFCIAGNIGALGVFKYADLLVKSVNALTGSHLALLELALPIGISFYTFQALSYVIDVYRGTVAAQKNPITFGTYIALFPQLIAGPIVQYKTVERQLVSRRESSGLFASGIHRFTVGLGKKVLLANQVGLLWDTVAALPGESLPALTAWLGAVAFTFLMYFDFSGYSDMAIGLGRMLGFEFLENFDYPYLSRSITEYWRRWHISLGTWFREYVYIPLGGNRRGLPRQILNLVIVWGLTGLWHGASWNFVLWGLYFFVFLAAEKFLLAERLPRIPRALRHLAVLVIVYFCWVIFKFRDPAALGTILSGLFGGNGAATDMAVSLSFQNNLFLLIVAAVACTPLTARLWQRLKEATGPEGRLCESRFWRGVCAVWEAIHPVVLLLISAMALAGNSYNPFLYFQF